MDNINFRQLIDGVNKQFHDCNVNPPTNTIAHIFRKESQENFISDWIAYLIDPVSFGNAEPLNALLEVAGFDDCIDENGIIEISREKTFDDQRRIDFYIETEELIIGIENKIWSGLGDQQLEDYSESLEKLAESKEKEVRKILLLPQNNTSIDLSENNSDISVSGFVSVTYEDFANALKKLQINFIENLRSSFLLQDFITYVEEYLMDSNVDKKKNFDMVSFLFEHKNQLNELETCKNNLQTQFAKSVVKKLAETFDEEIWKIKTPRTGSYFQLFKEQWGIPVHFELLPTDRFPYKSIRVVLHTREGKDAEKNRTEELYNLQVKVENHIMEKYGQKEFELDYENGLESYNKSLDKVFSVLKDIVEEFTDTIDYEISLYASKSK